jgi:hypothetical protein
MSAIVVTLPLLPAGSADLYPSTHTELKEQSDFESPLRAKGEVDAQGSAGEGWCDAWRGVDGAVRSQRRECGPHGAETGKRAGWLPSYKKGGFLGMNPDF